MAANDRALRPDGHKAIVEALSGRFPEAQDFLLFRRHSIRHKKSVHRGVGVTQPADAIDWKPDDPETPLRVEHWLFWGTLFSEVVYSQFRDFYDGTNLQKMLLFPEVRGDCLSSCKFHLDPFDAVRLLIKTPNERLYKFDRSLTMEKHAASWLEVISGRGGADSLRGISSSVVDNCYAYVSAPIEY